MCALRCASFEDHFKKVILPLLIKGKMRLETPLYHKYTKNASSFHDIADLAQNPAYACTLMINKKSHLHEV